MLAAVSFATAAQADIVYQDDFNSENGGTGALNFSSFTLWNVTDGGVDLVGNGFYDGYPGNGLYVDLTGSYGSDPGRCQPSRPLHPVSTC